MAPDGKWRRKLVRTLETNYARAPRFRVAMDVLGPLINRDTDDLAAYNIEAITTISRRLGLHARFVRQSEVESTGTATTLLVSLTRAVGADAYLCGGGAEGYQKDELFAEADLVLRNQNFAVQPYGDTKRFLPGLSVIDYLMWSDEWL